MPEDRDKLAVALSCLGAVVPIALFLVEKSPSSVSILLLCMCGLFVYPILHFSKKGWRYVLFAVSIVVTFAFGYGTWPKEQPPPPQIGIHEPRPSSAQSQDHTHEVLPAPDDPETRRPALNKSHSVEAPQSIQIGDFLMSMKECTRGFNWPEITRDGVHCVGTVENKKNAKLQLTFTQGRVINDKHNVYTVSAGPYLFGLPGMLFLGAGCCSEELIPDLPENFGFTMRIMNGEATSLNLVLDFTSSGSPAQGEVVFRNIPIREE
jgi:hypothetical protein